MSDIFRKEAVRRAKVKELAEKPPFDLNSFCFDKQLAFILEENRFKVACCSRRAGKTLAIAADLIDTCLKEKDVLTVYITLTSKNARNIIWGDIKKIIEDHKLNAKTDETRLRVYFPDTRSELRCEGAKDESECEKFRGWKIRKCYIDEAQSFRPYLRNFIYNILLGTLRDQRGTLGITGTPGPLLAGVFYDMTKNAQMAQHPWTAFENPHMHDPVNGKDLMVTLHEEWALKGVTINDPGVQREDFGRWVEDTNALVYKFNKIKNVTSNIPHDELTYVFGIDIGWNDADAIAVLGYNFKDQNVYLVEEWIENKQTITDLVNKIQELSAKYKPVKMVMDAGALGKKIQEEIKQRHAIPVEAAEKHRKFEFIELLNDDLRTAKFKAFPDSRFEQDSVLTLWDRSEPGKLKIDDRYHTDIGDAVLYAWRECKHFIPKDSSVNHKRDTEAYWKEYWAKVSEHEHAKETDNELDVSDDDLKYIFDS
jgi:PBSX family phage terminase large subunit